MISQNPVKGIWKKLVLQSKALHPHQICSVISILVIVKGESAQVINTHVVILSGLQIRIKDEVSTYPLSRVTGTLKMTDWLSVRKEESTSPHIRCYWLDDGKEEDLPTFMSIFDRNLIVVLLVVNNKDNFKIDAKFLWTIKAYDFPVAVVTRSVGRILEDLLRKHEREVQGRLEMSTVTTNFQDETKQEPPQGFYQ